jgi:hypothetical protein
MSNKPTSLILFKRRAPDNSETEHLISEIDNEIARRTDLNARIIAHNKRVREAKLEAEAKAKAYKSTRIINRTAINNNVNMF